MTNKNITNSNKTNKNPDSEKNILDFGNVLTNKKIGNEESDDDTNEDDFKFSTTKSEHFSFDMRIIETLENYKID